MTASVEDERENEEREKEAMEAGRVQNLLRLSTDLIGFLVEDQPRGKQQRVLILLGDKSNKSCGFHRASARSARPSSTPPHSRLSDGDKLNREGPSTTDSSYSFIFLSDREAEDTQET